MELPEPPKHLKSEGRAFFTAIAAEYRISDALGVSLLTTAASALDRMRAAQRVLAKEGMFTTDRYGCQKAHAAVRIELDSRNGFLAALKSLNLDLEPLANLGGVPPYRRNANAPRDTAPPNLVPIRR